MVLRSATSTASHDRHSSEPALIAGRFRIEAPLGKGGAAQLFQVVDVARERTLALKLLSPGSHEKLRELFELEYQTLASLKHPHTVEVYELGRDERGDFYTMELLQGEDLSSCAPVPWRAACDYLRDASEALGLLHARKLIHRDVSPKNLWRSRDGRVKLIDFGALAAFGRTTHVIGTPPFVPPEALELRALDQHADLYALGAVAYFLLTGRHAYPARAIQELHELWARPLPAPSRVLAQLERHDLEPIPAELDALVLALLQPYEQARPHDSSEVIDRLDALRGETRGSDQDAIEARLSNAAYVSRVREQRRFTRLLRLAERGRGQACSIESEPGLGRTRTLTELGLSARMARATVLQVTAAADGALFGCASELCLALFDALPQFASAAAAPHARLLAHLSLALQKRLGVTPEPASEIPGELRSRVSAAFCAFFSSVAREHLLCMLVDNIERVDDGSAACLLSLAMARRSGRLLLAWSSVREPGRAPSLVVRALNNLAHRMLLPPLNDRELLALLTSVFGAADHLTRLSSRLFRATRGNPGHALELCRELMQRGLISYVHGSWVLPRELDEATLAKSREQVLSLLHGRVQGPARQLAQALSVQAGPLSPALCRALAASGGESLLPNLGELITHGVLIPVGSNLQFAHDGFRKLCVSEQSPELLRRARRALAEHLLESPDCGAVERAQAGVHLLAANDARGLPLLLQASQKLLTQEPDKLTAAAPALEEALSLGRTRGLSAYQRASLLGALVMAGYLGDRRYVDTYGHEAVDTLQKLCEMPLARRLSRYLGRGLGLLCALAVAGVRFLRHGRAAAIPNFPGLLQLMMSSAATVAGTKSICFDPDGAEAYAQVIQPFSALGMRHAAGFMAEYCLVIALTTRDRMSECTERRRRLITLLDNPRLYRGHLTPALRSLARGGAVFGLASLEAHTDTQEALRLAEQLEQSGLALDRVYADQIRTICYGYRGDMVLHRRFLERAELHAIARGTTWQIETWSPGPMSSLSLYIKDVLLAKHASEQMRRLSESLPSVRPHARHMRGVYLLLRGRPAQALPWMEGVLQEPPLSRTAWGHSHGVLARAYNQLGDHARARAACIRVLEHTAPRDFAFVKLNLVVKCELALANAGLGRVQEAEQQLRALHAQHDPNQNPLTMGLVHEAELELALMKNDLAAARVQLARMERVYYQTNAPSLVQHCKSMAARLARLSAEGSSAPLEDALGLGTHASSAGDWTSELKATLQLSLADQARQALSILARKVRADRGVLFLANADGLPRVAATLALEAPSEQLSDWACERLLRELDGDERTQRVDALTRDRRGSPVLQDQSVCYRSYLLCVRDSEFPVVGLAALGRELDAPAACPNDVLRGLAQHLRDALTR